MKNFIITIGAIILMSTIMYFQVDCNEMMRYREQLKFVADEAAATASVFVSANDFGEGYKIYEDMAAKAAADKMIRLNLKTKSPVTYEIYFEDDSQVKRGYNQGGDKIFLKQFTATKPRVSILLNGGKPKFRLPFLKSNKDIIVKSYYEYVAF
ncbi:MAG: hypothetical protein RR313_07060 [Anaerovoracaceae bacterium]